MSAINRKDFDKLNIREKKEKRKRTTGNKINANFPKSCAVSESILSHKKLLVSHKYGFFIIHCVVSPVCVKHPLDFQNKNNAC